MAYQISPVQRKAIGQIGKEAHTLEERGGTESSD